MCRLEMEISTLYNRNLALSLAAGNATIWKPSDTTPLSAIAVTKIVATVLERNGIDGAVAGLVCGNKAVGEGLVRSKHVDMSELSLSSTLGSCVVVVMLLISPCLESRLLAAKMLVALLGKMFRIALARFCSS